MPIRLVYPLVILILVCGSAYGQGNPPQAPVGHRQPTQSTVPQEVDQTPTDKKLKELDDALAKKLKSICRGC
jgi:hypothetical protein